MANEVVDVDESSQPASVQSNVNACTSDSCDCSTSGGTASPDGSVQSSQGVSKQADADDSPSPKLGGRSDRERRWLEETCIVFQGANPRRAKEA